MAEGLLAKEDLKEDDTHAPHVNLEAVNERGTYLGVDHRRVVGHHEALWCLVPIGADALRSKFNSLLVLVHGLAEAKVSDLDLAIVKKDVLGFQIVMDDLLFRFIQVLQSAQDLRYYQLGLLLRYLFVLLQVEVEVRALAELQHSTEAVVVDLDRIVVAHNSPIVQVLMNLVLTQCMLNVTLLNLLAPLVVEVVDLAGYLTAVFQVIGFVYLGVAALTKEAEYQVLIGEDTIALLGLHAIILRAFFVAHALEFVHVEALLLLQDLELLSNPALLVL